VTGIGQAIVLIDVPLRAEPFVLFFVTGVLTNVRISSDVEFGLLLLFVEMIVSCIYPLDISL
jgi:hypothetical protein